MKTGPNFMLQGYYIQQSIWKLVGMGVSLGRLSFLIELFIGFRRSRMRKVSGFCIIFALSKFLVIKWDTAPR